MSRGNLILAAIAAVLALLLILDRPAPPPAAPAGLTSLAPAEVNRIDLFLGNAARPAIALRRTDDSWRLQQPVNVAADDFAVSQILELLEAPSLDRRETATQDLALLKLAPPLWRVRYDDTELRIGGVESLRQQRYVQLGDTLHLVADFNPGPFDGNYADLVSRRLLPEGAEIVQIRWPDGEAVPAAAIPEERLQLWRDAEAQWTARPLPTDFRSVRSRVTLTLADGSIDFLISELEPRFKLIRPDIDVLYNLAPSAAAELLTP